MLHPIITIVLLSLLAVFAGDVPAAASADTAGMADSALWRAVHGPLLSIARAGNRLVAVGDRGAILLSDDQARTWRRVDSATTVLLTCVLFTSATEGWAAGQDSVIVHTSDAGAHWAQQHSVSGSDRAIFALAAIAPHHLVAAGAYATLLETSDGEIWDEQKLPSLDEDYHLNGARMRRSELVLAGEAGHIFVRRASAWSQMPVPYKGSQFGLLDTPDGALFSFGLRGSLFMSGYPGSGWTRIQTGEKNSLFGGTVTADGALVLVGANGEVVSFNPQTARCRLLPAATEKTLSGVIETSVGTLVAVGNDGVRIIDPSATGARCPGLAR